MPGDITRCVPEDIQNDAWNEFQRSLTPKERKRMESVSTSKQLVEHVQELQEPYNKSGLVQAFKRIQPFIERIQSYHETIKVWLQGAPHAVVFLWGSLYLVFEIATRNHQALNLILATLEQAERQISRFEDYARSLSGRPNTFKPILVQYFKELLSFCLDSFTYLKRRPRSNLVISIFSPFSLTVAPRIKRLEVLSKDIDREFDVARFNCGETNYRALFRGLQPLEAIQRQLEQLLSLHRPRSVNQQFALSYSRRVFLDIPHQSDSSRTSRSHQSSSGPSQTMLLPERFNNLPQPRQGCFGRSRELDLLQGYLYDGERQEGLRVACLTGMRGVGKTHLALEYAYRHLQEHFVTLWIHSDNLQKLRQSFADALHCAQLADESVQHPDQLRELVKRWLSNLSKKGKGLQRRLLVFSKPTDLFADISGDCRRWLIVFDNVEECSELELYLPTEGNGTVLITTTCDDLARVRAPERMVVVEPYSGDLGSQFLLTLTNADTSDEEEVRAARHLTETVGHLPLALELVGNYVLSQGRSLAAFLEDYPNLDSGFLFNSNLQKWTPARFKDSIDRIWNLHLDQTALNSSHHLKAGSRRLINMLAFLDEDGAPLSLFQEPNREAMLFEGPVCPQEIQDLDKLVDNPFNEILALNGAIIQLRDRTLVKLNNHTQKFQCHRLVRLSVQKAMPPRTRLRIFQRLVFLLNAVFPTQEDGRPLHNKWKKCESFANQVRALLKSREMFKEDVGHPVLLCEVAARCAWYFIELGQYSMATQMAEQSLDICQTALHSGHHPGYSTWFIKDMTSHLYNVLATVERERPGPDFGIALSQHVLDIRLNNRRDANSDDEAWIAAAERNLAVSLISLYHLKEALDILVRLRIRDDMRANEDVYLRNTSICLRMLGRLDEALDVNSLALSAAREKRGEHSEQVALCYFDLVNILICQGDTITAWKTLEECLSRRNVSFFPHDSATLVRHKARDVAHPNKAGEAFTLHKAGEAATLEGRHHDSIPFYKQALQILRNCECHPGAICRTAFALGSAYQQTGAVAEYMDCLELGKSYMAMIQEEEDTSQRGFEARNYDSFVQVGFR